MIFGNQKSMIFSLIKYSSDYELVIEDLIQILDLEKQQDEKLRDWGEQFLRDYRVNPDKFDSEFITTYMPPPPKAPNIPLPVSFTPHILGEDEQGQFGGGINLYGRQVGVNDVIGDSSVTGEPIGNASSRYF